MNIATAISGVLTERSALQQTEALFSPTYISEHMQRLAQYTSALEENLAENEKLLELREAELFKEYREQGMSTNAAQTQLKYEVAVDKAEILRLVRLCNTSWRMIATSQSRIKHLLAEAANQI
jgi:hypothetical protein